ncbi:hypothetical protein AC244_21995 [Ensifer adhaerens]|uniref:Uncharacterized protein n=1 Tax=Ensifer adhaerens TaxID=106592 RepID=A0A0L8BLY8_ENSAD|nr:hypothetical protein AC244_21995 [Ensifer adhaerens]
MFSAATRLEAAHGSLVAFLLSALASGESDARRGVRPLCRDLAHIPISQRFEAVWPSHSRTTGVLS